VTVIIPTHNRLELLLNRALPSVRSQTHRHLEIIVAAHGCTDGTVERVEAIYDKRIRVLDVPRHQTYPPTAENHWLAGPVVPANAALGAVRGQWIARIDDDDVWTPDHIRDLLTFAQAYGHEFVTLVGGTQTWLYRSYLRFFRYNPDCWRKSWNRVNDTDLQDRMWRAGVRMGYLDKVHAYVLPRPGEKTIGLKAYQDNKVKKERDLSFR
jgi:glycosyltransferase involved in cell wall biosynthesis